MRSTPTNHLLCRFKSVKYNPASWRVPYDHVVWKDSKQTLVVYCLQLLLVLLLYPIPEDGRGTPPKNYFRHYFGRLHRPHDFQFLVDGMTRILSQPVRLLLLPYLSLACMVTYTYRATDGSYKFIPSGESKVCQMGPGNAHAFLGNAAVQQEIQVFYHRLESLA